MKKRNKKYTPRGTSIPMLINRKLEENVEGKEELSMLHAFQYGTATMSDYDYLVRMANMLNVASQNKGENLKQAVDAINFLASLILDRYKAKGKFGVNGDELAALRDVVTFYDAFWKRQTTNLYNQCVAELNAFYAELEQNRKAA
jgi:hypothetical protein